MELMSNSRDIFSKISLKIITILPRKWTAFIFCSLLNIGFSLGQTPSECTYNYQMAAVLDTVFNDDQFFRQQFREIESAFGRNSKQMFDHRKLIKSKDSINILKVKEILDQYGWLGPDIVGTQGNATLFLVIQHADLEIQEKYLPMLRDAVKMGNANASNLALLEDRIAIRKGEKQVYGSQIGRDQDTGESYVLPLIDPDNVDLRRSKVGLGPLKDYIANWGLSWDPEEYKRKLPEFEAKQKE